MNIQGYLSEVIRVYKTGAATEHSYRSALQTLFSSIDENIKALNEPKRVKCGAPDFLVNRGEIVVGHVEAKDIGKNLTTLKGAEAEQKSRYLKALPNLIYTNCLDFEFYREGELISKICVADFDKGIQPKSDAFQSLENQLKDFSAQKTQTITSSERLAEIMAGKAVLIKDVLFNALREDKEDQQTEISAQYKAFQEHLIHDITVGEFADIYAETIAYGMFAARLHDDTLGTFSRQEALELLPKSNPFLRSLFGYIAGYDLDERIKWIIDDLADVFQAANVKKLMENFGSLTGRNDPFLHFYETFLAKYNPAKRKARGVWYTPEPVVNFIVRAVDEILQCEFGLSDGLADTSRVTIDWDTGQTDKKGKPVSLKKSVHRVQILDPATGTGTFLAEVIKQVSPKVKGVAEGVWSGYIEKDLIPRLHGFELLMASYAMCHMKLDMILAELGYKPSSSPPRLGVYLTNSLEEGKREVRDLFMAQWLTREAQEANAIKRQTPIMCVIGNPPYSGVSQNMGDWIVNLIEEYKYVDGVHFGERKHWLHDDYVKFIRLAEELISKNGDGVLSFITNHGYLDNPTFRGMRWHLMQTFDKIFVLDLHGNVKKQTSTSEAKDDMNVFDIQQGVAIFIGIKFKKKISKKKVTKKKVSNIGNSEVYHGELWGKRKNKYQLLFDSNYRELIKTKLEPSHPQFSFVPCDENSREKYEEGFHISDLFQIGTMGVQTSRDKFAIAYSREEIVKRLEYFTDENHTDSEIREHFFSSKKAGKYLAGDSRGWKMVEARKRIDVNKNADLLIPINYRPFDTRYTYFSGDLIDWPREKVMRHFLNGENLSLLFPRQLASTPYNHIFVTDCISEMCVISNRTKEQNAVYPLYIYSDELDLDQSRRINFDEKLWRKIKKFAKHPKHGIPDEVETFDYIYGVLHCPAYRTRYVNFLKIDFPRIPWPSSPDEFWDVTRKGAQLRKLHLMEPAAIGQAPFTFKGDGSAEVEKPRFDGGKVWINETQFFDGVPVIAWEFFIGGYQPAQKWLKDRKGRALSFKDVKHYQQIIKILFETDRIMKTIMLNLDGKVQS